MGEIKVIHERLDFQPQKLHLSIWKAHSTNIKGVIAGIHGLTSHGEQCFHYFGPYMAERGWTTIAVDMPGLGHWAPENKKAEKLHWSMNGRTIASLLKWCRKYAPNKKLILVGVSISVVSSIEHILKNNGNQNSLPDCTIFAVPALNVQLPIYAYPIFLSLGILTPNIKLGLKRFEPDIKSNDPASIINQVNPYSLKEISVGYATEMYRSMRKLKMKRKKNPMSKWPKNIPILMLTAGLDTVTKVKYSRFFYNMLPQEIFTRYIHYERAHHYLFYEDNRDVIFEDIYQFLNDSV